MVKFRANQIQAPGEAPKLLGLGISRKNVERLEQGKPIIVRGAEVGFPELDILIFFKETDAELAKAVEPFITDETELHTFTEGRA
jgi:hypothetical protein